MKIEIPVQDYEHILQLIQKRRRIWKGSIASFFVGLCITVIWNYITWKLSSSHGFFIIIIALFISWTMKTVSKDTSYKSLFISSIVFVLQVSLGIFLNVIILVAYRNEVDLLFVHKIINFEMLVYTLKRMFYPIDILFVVFSFYILISHSRLSERKEVLKIYAFLEKSRGF